MAKRKGSETSGAESGAATVAQTNHHDGPVDVGQQDHTLEELGGLAEEVQSFLSKRSELARKLAQEIEATEKKLAELKRTAALLFPAGGNGQSEKERPERKPKKAALGRAVKSERDDAGDEKQLRIETMDTESAVANNAEGSAAPSGAVAEPAGESS